VIVKQEQQNWRSLQVMTQEFIQNESGRVLRGLQIITSLDLSERIRAKELWN